MKSIYFLAFAGLLLLGQACTNDGKANKPKTPEEEALDLSEKVEEIAKKGSTAMSTDTDVPVPEWVADIMKTNPGDAMVIVCKDAGQDLFFINPCRACPVQLTEVYNDKQEKICYIGGPDQEITCPEFKFDGSKDCKPVNLLSLNQQQGAGHSDHDGHNH